MPERLTVSVNEAAEMLGISRAHVYALVRTEEIPSLRLGKRIVVPLAALKTLVDESSVIDLRDAAAVDTADAS